MFPPPLRPRRFRVPCPVRKRGLAADCDEDREGSENPPCHGMLTGLPRLAGCRDVVPEDGFTMSDDGTTMPCASCTKGARERGEGGIQKQVDPSRASRHRSGSREVRAKHRAVGFCAVGGPNEPFFAISTDRRAAWPLLLSSRCTQYVCSRPWLSLEFAMVTIVLGGFWWVSSILHVSATVFSYNSRRPPCTQARFMYTRARKPSTVD